MGCLSRWCTICTLIMTWTALFLILGAKCKPSSCSSVSINSATAAVAFWLLITVTQTVSCCSVPSCCVQYVSNGLVAVVECCVTGVSHGSCAGAFSFRRFHQRLRHGRGSHRRHRHHLWTWTWASWLTMLRRRVSLSHHCSVSARQGAMFLVRQNTSKLGNYHELLLRLRKPSLQHLQCTTAWLTVATTLLTTVYKLPITWTLCCRITTPTRKSPVPWRSLKSSRCIIVLLQSLLSLTQQLLISRVRLSQA